MAQQGYIFKQRGSWFLRYRDNFSVDGKIVRKQKCVKLADYCDRYRCERDVQPLADEKLATVKQSAKCSHTGIMFTEYVETIFLPMVERTKKPSTYAAYKTYYERYLKPWSADYALRDFTIAIVSSILESAASAHELNGETLKKIRSITSAVFHYAITKGAFPAKSEADNPASCAAIPETAKAPEPTETATFQEVQAYLAALKDKPLARAAVALMAFTGARPGEARGMRWEEWDRAEQHIAINRSVWHREIGTPKTEKSTGLVAVDEQLHGILLDLWNARGCPIGGYILAGTRKTKKNGTNGHPVILDNLSKRVIRPAVEKAKLTWKGWYALRRFHGTRVRMKSNSETGAKALRNSKEVFDKHYLKPDAVLPDVRKAVKRAVSGLVQ
jgi:integrase